MTEHLMHSVQARPSIQNLAGSLLRDIANSAMGRADVAPFWFGESDVPTARFIRDEVTRSLNDCETFYSENLGRPYLREAIATYLSGLHDRPIDVARIGAISSGVTGLMIASELLLSAGDRVVVITPLWPNVCEIPKILDAQVERVLLHVCDGRWTLDLERLLDALTPKTRALFINSPNNPTGWTIDEPTADAILRHCRKHGIWIVCDDVYERLVYDPNQRSAPSFLKLGEPDDRIISVNSFSKAWAMTGWRAGWMVVPPALAPDLTKVVEYNFSCMFEPVQRAAAIALQQGEQEVERMRAMLAHTRALLANALTSLPGIEVPDAGGAMYLFFRIAGHDDSVSLARQLLNQTGLGLAPGAAFGPEGDGWLRWCHAVSSDAKLLDGVDRLAGFLSRARA
ncbi:MULTISPECIES: pyridoxal phosphate-dependent aminotransferase [Burkholderia]|uniref:pyridoxal phosphate-dependent aminotransferase n=1 Tax=Burkholderia TaxID=32008 RepID=UPI00064F1D8F|nr:MULTISPECIES: pyridoxal phosphate-dependent aminotransferase [Burkholderia]KML19717.1 aspartate aminotransferase [Burkholderia cepacia]KMN59559.1 aspartate aminotransferase [Burkholderia sp. LK4]